MRCARRLSDQRFHSCLALGMAAVFLAPAQAEPVAIGAAATQPAAVGVGTWHAAGLPIARIEFRGGAAYERGQPVVCVVRLPSPVPLAGSTVRVRVADSLGRLLVDRPAVIAAGERGESHEIPLTVEVPAVLAQRHWLQAIVTGGDGSVHLAQGEFVYRLPAEWDDYICGVWQRHNPKRIPYLQDMYVTCSQWTGSAVEPPLQWIDANYRYYVEGTGNWAYASYHIWMPDKEKTHYYELARKAFLADRTNMRILERDPCLSNHVIRDRIAQQFGNVAKIHRDYRPLYYTVADESGVANQAAPFDFCFSPDCQATFREWLQKRYASLEALNEQWGTRYQTWDEVRGATTDEIFARQDDNFSAWCDHKDFMDDVLIGAYALAGEAVRRFDPKGRLGMGGAQGPTALAGWDFWKLCQVFDAMEAYYIGNNYEVMRSFNEDLIPFHCSFGPGNPEKHLIWYLFIHGDRGLIAWDDPSDYVNDEGRYSDRAKEAKEWYRELTGGIGKLRIASQRVDDPVALYYSQPSMRVHWVLEVRPRGQNWVLRGSGSERTDSRYFRLRESWVKLIEDNGLQYRFLAGEQVSRGDLKTYDGRSGFKVLILPEIVALSQDEADAIRRFVEAGGTVIADRMPGEFDEHGKRRDRSPLADLFASGGDGRAILLDQDMVPYHQDRLFEGREQATKQAVGEKLLAAIGGSRVTPQVAGRDDQPVTGVETTVWRNGEVELIALHRNPQLRVNELGPQEYKSNAKFEVPVELTVRRGEPVVWYDVRAGRRLAAGRQVELTLQPFEPLFLAAFPTEAQPFRTDVDAVAGTIRIQPGQPCGMARPVYHLAFIGPDGQERLVYRTNVAIEPAGQTVPLPLALNDTRGTWTLEVREVATGSTQRVLFDKTR